MVLRFDPEPHILPEEAEEVAPEERLTEDEDLWSALGLHDTNAIAGARYRLTHFQEQGELRGMQEPWATWTGVRLQRLREGEQRRYE